MQKRSAGAGQYGRAARCRRRANHRCRNSQPAEHCSRFWKNKFDPELIGGIVLRVGDTVYDGSVATQLERLREQMID